MKAIEISEGLKKLNEALSDKGKERAAAAIKETYGIKDDVVVKSVKDWEDDQMEAALKKILGPDADKDDGPHSKFWMVMGSFTSYGMDSYVVTWESKSEKGTDVVTMFGKDTWCNDFTSYEQLAKESIKNV